MAESSSRQDGTPSGAPAPRVDVPDPLAPQGLKQMAFRLGLPVLGVWMIGGLIAGVSTSATAIGFALGIPGLATVVVIGVVIWALRQARKTRNVAAVLADAGTAEGRQAALDKLDADFGKKDPAAIFARAQLVMQEDPRRALEILEQVDLAKVMAPVADEARAQRGMIHLLLGEATLARDLVDGISMDRHQDVRARAMMGAVMAEAWARTGQAKKAVETLELFDESDPEYEQLRPQLLRAQAYAYAHASDPKKMRRALRRLRDIDARALGGFLVKKGHPLLQKEARKMLEQSGQVPRKMVVQRR